MNEYDRTQGIGGSDVPIIVGMSPYRSALDLWDEKRGNAIEREPSIAMRLGTLLEDGIARLYAEQQQVKITKPSKPFGLYRAVGGELLVDPQVERRLGYPAWAQVDRVRVGRPRVGVEVKHTSVHDRFDEGFVPDDVAVQVQHGMLLTGWQAFDVVALVAGREFVVNRVERDEEAIEAIRVACLDFWQKVQSGEEPAPDGSDAAGAYLRKKYGTEEPGRELVATHDMMPIIADLLTARAEQGDAERRVEALKQRLMQIMGDAEVLTAPGDVRFTWKSQQGRTDWKATAADLRRLIERWRDLPKGAARTPDIQVDDDALNFIESMHRGEPTRVFRVSGKMTAL